MLYILGRVCKIAKSNYYLRHVCCPSIRHSVRPSFLMEQLGFHWRDFHGIKYLNVFRRSAKKILVSFKSYKNKGYFTWTPSEDFNCPFCIRKFTVLIILQWDATQSSLFIILQVHSTCFGCQPHPSSGVHKTVTTASGTGGCSYSFVYYWWWVWLTSETCRMNLQNNKYTALCCISLDSY